MSEPSVVRVLFVLGSLAGGGAERVAVDLLNHCDPGRVDLRLGLLRREGDYLSRARPDRLLGPIGRRRGPIDAARAPFDVAAMIAQASPNVVMSFGPGPSLAVAAALSGRGRRRPYWICREDSNPWAEIENQAGGAMARSALALAIGRAWRDADCVLTVSEDLAAALADRVPQVRAIHNPIDVDMIEAAASEPIAAVPARPFVIAAGRLVRQKGFDRLLEAFAASGVAKEMDLVILGDGPQREPLARRADQLGVALRLPGFQANPWAWFARTRLFVLPSRWEGFGNVVAEAMASGAPVLVSDCDFGPREQVTHGVDGWIAGPEALASALDRLLADPRLCARLAEAGRARARQFAAPRIAEAYMRLFVSPPVRPSERQPVGEAASLAA